MKRILIVMLSGLCLLAGLAFSACAKETGDCKHENAASSVVQEATCTEDGLKSFTCPDCNETWTEPIEKLGHSYQKNDDLSVAASCTAPGKTVEVCSRCQNVRTTPLEQLHHEYETDETASTAATCTTVGVTVRICKNCSDRQEIFTAATGHRWEGEDCTGKHCTACTATLPATATHNYRATETVAATCEADGHTDYVCTACGDSYTETTPKTGHAYRIVSETEEDTPKEGETCVFAAARVLRCDNCPSEITQNYEVVHHTFITKIVRDATCMAPGEKHIECSACHEVKENSQQAIAINASAHQWDEGTREGNVLTYKCNLGDHEKKSIVAEENAKEVGVTKEALQETNEVVVKGVAIEMNDAAKSSLPTGNLTLALDSTTDLNTLEGVDPSLNEKLSGKEIYDITLSDGTSNTTSFGEGGEVTVRIPYTLAEGEDVDSIVIWYVNGDKLTPMKATYSNGFVTFVTEHFSYYTVGKYTAEEMCAEFGHIRIERYKAPTCFEQGYRIEVCTRCNAILTPEAQRVLPALQHEWEESGTPATCTASGTVTRTCSHCNTVVTTVVPATGHSWTQTNETAATCTAAGSRTFRCEHCDETYTALLPQLSHNFSAVVTEPTCTEDGYTTYTCTNDGCGYEYRGAKVAALGHRWNLDAPTCGEGQVCTVCGAKGLDATGEHVFENGVCTVCGQGCEHEYEYVRTIPSTCRMPGYALSVCSKCGAEKREYLPIGDHTFENGVCTVCGANDEASARFFENFFASLYSEAYSVHSDGFTFSMVDGRDDTNGQGTLLDVRVRMTPDGKTLYYMHVVESYTDRSGRTDEEILYVFDGDYLYTKYTEDDDTTYSKSVSDGTLPEPLAAIMGVMQNQAIADYANTLKTANKDLFSRLLLTAANTFFAREAAADGYTVTVQTEALAALVKAMKEENVETFFDAQFGEGKFASLVDFIDDVVFTLPLPSAVTRIFNTAADYGIDRAVLFKLIEDILTEQTGDQISIEDLILSYSTATLAEVAAEMQETDAAELEGMFDQMVEMFTDESTTVYDVLDMMVPVGEGVLFSESIGLALDGLLQSGVAELVFTTNSAGSILSLTASVDGFETEVQGQTTTLGGDFTAYWNYKGEIAAGEEFALLTSPFDALREEVRKGNGTYTLEGDIASLESTQKQHLTLEWTVEGGRLVLNGTLDREYVYDRSETGLGTTMERGEIQRFLFHVEDAEKMQVSAWANCGDWLKYSLYPEGTFSSIQFYREYNEEGEIVDQGEEERGSDREYRDSVYLYFLPAEKQFAVQSQHHLVRDEELSTTFDMVDCEEAYFDVYSCTECGEKDVERVSYYKWHNYVESVTLDEGATSCTEGVTRTAECTQCGESETEHFYEHITTRTYEDLQTPHGTLRLTIESCACGENAYFEYRNYDGGEGCRFEYSGSLPRTEDGHEVDLYNCVITGCTAYMTEEYWREEDLSTCTVTNHRVYRFYSDEETQIGKTEGYSFQSSYLEHDLHSPEVSEKQFDLDADGYTGTRTEYTYPCPHNYRRVEEFRYDEYGRSIYRSYEYYLGGELTSGFREERVFTGCDYVLTYAELPERPDGYTRQERGTEHAIAEPEFLPETCTQSGYDYGRCAVCEQDVYSWRTYPRDHQFENGVCNQCGLKDEQSNSGHIVFEDLTDYLRGTEYIVGVWDRERGYSEQPMLQLVYLNAEGYEQLVLLEGIDIRRSYIVPDPSEDHLNEYLYIIDMAAIKAKIDPAVGTFVGLRLSIVPDRMYDWEVVSITLADEAAELWDMVREAEGGKLGLESWGMPYLSLEEDGSIVYFERYETSDRIDESTSTEGEIEYTTYSVEMTERRIVLGTKSIVLTLNGNWKEFRFRGRVEVTRYTVTYREHMEEGKPVTEEISRTPEETSYEEDSVSFYFNPVEKTVTRVYPSEDPGQA